MDARCEHTRRRLLPQSGDQEGVELKLATNNGEFHHDDAETRLYGDGMAAFAVKKCHREMRSSLGKRDGAAE